MTTWRMAFKCGSRGHNMFPECKERGIAAITYSEIAEIDLSQYAEGEPKDRWSHLEPGQKGSLHKLAYEMQPGDVIYAKDGTRIVGRGVVAGPYLFGGDSLVDPHGTWWSHCVPVDWDDSFVPVEITLGAEPTTVLKLEGSRLRKLEGAIAGRQADAQIRVLFARIGWMTFYNGPQPGDEKPIAGGKWNREHLGHEIYNFRNVDGYYRGHFEPPGKIAFDIKKLIRLERIDPRATGERLDGVLVVFVARRPKEGGQVVVGWHRDATVYRTRQDAEAPDLERYGFYCKVRREKAVLLPTGLRTWEIPNETKTFGQSNVCYVLDTEGEDKGLAWQRNIVQAIRQYRGENLLENPAVEAEELIGVVSGGQGFGLSPAERRLVEMYAMRTATKHFRSKGYRVEDTHKIKPFDLICRKNDEEWFVEVKGTTSGMERIFLTKNEVKHAKAHSNRSVLFLLSGIALDRVNGAASNGHQRVIMPWHPIDSELIPLQYMYELPQDRP